MCHSKKCLLVTVQVSLWFVNYLSFPHRKYHPPPPFLHHSAPTRAAYPPCIFVWKTTFFYFNMCLNRIKTHMCHSKGCHSPHGLYIILVCIKKLANGGFLFISLLSHMFFLPCHYFFYDPSPAEAADSWSPFVTVWYISWQNNSLDV